MARSRASANVTASVDVHVEGLRQLRRALGAIDPELTRELRVEFKAIAERIASAIRRKVPLGPPAGGHARDSIKGGATAGTAYVKGGQRSIPYYGWLDFGGRGGRNKRNYRPYIREGRYIYPTIAEQHDQTVDAVNDVLARVTAKAGF